ncbi:MFS transporter [Candidatus Bathyarchaeota archaeon]|jgi:MFS transporter, DHA1 family, multidrug resistance protein|nr:MFS transporter [Candidatus Bathyarchaeota archaeon]
MKTPLKALYVVIFLISGAIGTIMLLSPVYAEELGASYMQLGMMGAYYAIGYTIMTLVTGLVMDRFEKVRIYLAFQTMNFISIGLLAFSNTIEQVLVVRLIIGLTAGTFWVSSSAITAAMSKPHKLTHNISLYNLSWISGLAVGPLIGGYLSDAVGFKAMFLAMSVTVLLGVGIIVVFMLPTVKLHGKLGRLTIDWKSVRAVLPAYLCLFPYTLSSGIYFSILPGYLKEFGITASIIGLLFTIGNVAKGLGFFGVERLVNWGTKRAIRLVSFLLAVSLAWIGYANTEYVMALPLALYGVTNGLLEPILLNWIAQNSPAESRSFTMSIYETVFGVGMIIGPVAAGFVTNIYPASMVYVLLAAASLLIIPFSVGLD